MKAVVAVAVAVVAVVAVAVIRSALPDREGKGQASCFVIYVYSGPLTDSVLRKLCLPCRTNSPNQF